MTFAVLRELHAIIGDALDDIEAVYRESSSSSTTVDGPSTPSRPTTTTPTFSPEHGYASPPPSPAMTSFPTTSLFSRPSTPTSTLDFPSLDAPYEAQSPAEMLMSHPMVSSAINRIVAAAGQMTMTVQMPFLSLSDAAMAYHLPSCLRLVEASHTVEILRESGPDGLHVRTIAEKTGVEMSKMAHVLRLLATHHFLRETSPNVFATNRISSLMDTGKQIEEIHAHPEAKYRGTNGISAFIGMWYLQKSSAYITEAYLLSSNKNVEEPTHAPFNFAFGCEGVGFFSWLEANSNRYRLERFGTAMTGTDSWEVPGAVLNGFDWQLLPRGSIVVDVGGGIGSTSMFLAHAFSNPSDEDALGLRFIIQDRKVVVEMGEKGWREKCPELLESGVAEFQVHDFFTPQPIKNAAVYFLRVILHDWPDDFARKILFLLREASGPQTKLVLADFILPLACTDDLSATEDEHSLSDIIGAEKALAPAPLLPNLGKASAHAYWMDLTMQATFNGQERTLREIITLAASAGWKVVRVTKAPGSLFGHIVAVP
ncbi:S-adenosyl-L-methionine-dependent methyltransferase, partial [Hymenopellis radicata]